MMMDITPKKKPVLSARNRVLLLKPAVKFYGYPPKQPTRCDSCKSSKDGRDCIGWLGWACEPCNDRKVKCSHAREDWKRDTVRRLKAGNLHGEENDLRVPLELKLRTSVPQKNISVKFKGKGKDKGKSNK